MPFLPKQGQNLFIDTLREMPTAAQKVTGAITSFMRPTQTTAEIQNEKKMSLLPTAVRDIKTKQAMGAGAVPLTTNPMLFVNDQEKYAGIPVASMEQKGVKVFQNVAKAAARKASMLHLEDAAALTKYIDAVRFKGKPQAPDMSETDWVAAERILQKTGNSMDMSMQSLANRAEELLRGGKSAAGVVNTGRPFVPEGKNVNTLMAEAKKYKTAEEFVTTVKTKHRPPDAEGGSPLNDVTSNGSFPLDIYSKDANRLYGSYGLHGESEAISLIKQFRGKPDANVTIYRSVNPNEERAINAGDWVTISRDYASQHGESNLENGFKIVSKEVKASDILNNGDSVLEWGYRPNGHTDFTKSQLIDIWQKANTQ